MCYKTFEPHRMVRRLPQGLERRNLTPSAVAASQMSSLVAANRACRTEAISVRGRQFAFDCKPDKLLQTARTCCHCRLILAGIKQFKKEIGLLSESIAHLYVPDSDVAGLQTLHVEVYFWHLQSVNLLKDTQPKLELKFST